MDLYARGEVQLFTNGSTLDRKTTAPICASCPVRFECLEWEMRSVGADTQGPWGLLDEPSRREFYEVWAEYRGIAVDIPDGLYPGNGGGQ